MSVESVPGRARGRVKRIDPDQRRPETEPVVPPPASQARPPRTSCEVVERRPLLRRLTRSVQDTPLTLVCAPAGSGKTVLVADWADRRGARRPVAWLSLTERDNHAGVFWAHLQLALVLVGALATDALRPMFPDSADVDVLSEQLLQLAAPIVLVIDAAERLRGRTVFDQLARLLDNVGDRLRVVMTTRTAPELPLHRYRVENRLTEIGPDQLAMGRAEVAELLAQHAPAPPDSVVDDVLSRTEGWAAGVRLAGLRLAEHGIGPPLEGFAEDYLRAEVLDGLTPDERELLTSTSVVADLPPGLATALTGRSDADTLVRDLATSNAFVRSVPGRPGVHRVHPLVRELVGEDLAARGPEATTRLHQRAATWFEESGQPEEVVRHAVAAGDWHDVAHLLVSGQAFGEIVAGTARGTRLAGIVNGIPEQGPAEVHLVRAALALRRGELDRAHGDLDRGELGLAEQRRASAAVVRTALRHAQGDVPGTLASAAEARAGLAGGLHEGTLLLAIVAAAEGAALLRSGDLDAACLALGDALRAAGEADTPLRLQGLAELALAEACRGHLTRAAALADTAEREAVERGVPVTDRPASVECARAWVALERQDLSQAQRSLDQVSRTVGRSGDPTLASLVTLLRARLMRDRGEGSSARRLLDHLSLPDGWLGDHLLLESHAVGARRDETTTRTRDEASVPTGTTRTPADPAPTGRILELLQRADERCLAGSTAAAKADVVRALGLARRERLRRPFAHTSPRIRAMVRSDPALHAKAGWLRPEQLSGRTEASAPAQGSEQVLEQVLERLSGRELEVLRHLSQLLTTDEIAAEMFISVNTVRTHVRRILEKLSVSRRNEAVRRGRELGLV